jgi:hypothetical protein
MTDVCAVPRDRKVGRVMDLFFRWRDAPRGHYRTNQHLGHLEDLVTILSLNATETTHSNVNRTLHRAHEDVRRANLI